MKMCSICAAELSPKFGQLYCSVACQSKAANDRTNARRSRLKGVKTPPAAPSPISAAAPAIVEAVPVNFRDSDGKVWHCIQIERSATKTKWLARYGDVDLGVWRDPEHSAARRLLELGLADRSHWLRTYRGAMPCLRANVGWLADHSSSEPDRGRLHTVKWRAFDMPAESTVELAEAA
jgi:hypothetical protein